MADGSVHWVERWCVSDRGSQEGLPRGSHVVRRRMRASEARRSARRAVLMVAVLGFMGLASLSGIEAASAPAAELDATDLAAAGLDISPNGTWLAAVSVTSDRPESHLVIWDVVTDTIAHQRPVVQVTQVAWSPDGSRLALCGGVQVEVVEVATWTSWHRELGGTADACVWSPESDAIAASPIVIGGLSRIWVFDAADGSLVGGLRGGDAVRPVAWGSEGVLLQGAFGGETTWWTPATDSRVAGPATGEAHAARVVIVEAPARWLIHTTDETLILFDPVNATELARWAGATLGSAGVSEGQAAFVEQLTRWPDRTTQLVDLSDGTGLVSSAWAPNTLAYDAVHGQVAGIVDGALEVWEVDRDNGTWLARAPGASLTLSSAGSAGTWTRAPGGVATLLTGTAATNTSANASLQWISARPETTEWVGGYADGTLIWWDTVNDSALGSWHPPSGARTGMWISPQRFAVGLGDGSLAFGGPLDGPDLTFSDVAVLASVEDMDLLSTGSIAVVGGVHLGIIDPSDGSRLRRDILPDDVTAIASHPVDATAVLIVGDEPLGWHLERGAVLWRTAEAGTVHGVGHLGADLVAIHVGERIILRDADRGHELAGRLEPPDGRVSAIEGTAGGLLVLSPQGNLTLHADSTGVPIRRLTAASGPITSLDWSGGDDGLVTGTGTGQVSRWSSDGRAEIARFVDLGSEVVGACTTASGRVLAIGLADGRIILDDARASRHVEYLGHDLVDLDCAAEADLIVTSAHDAQELLIRSATGGAAPVVNHTAILFDWGDAALSPDGAWLAADRGDAVVLWSRRIGVPVVSAHLEGSGPVDLSDSTIAWVHPDGDARTRAVDRVGDEITMTTGLVGIRALSLDPITNDLAVYTDRELRLWSAAGASVRLTQQTMHEGLVAVHPDGARTAHTADGGLTVTILRDDADGDGVSQAADAWWLDACPTTSGSSWRDAHGCADRDSDGTSDDADDLPDDDSRSLDTDSDGVADHDHLGDQADAFPFDATQHEDTDGDGHGDNHSSTLDPATGLRTTIGDAYPDDPAAWSDDDDDGRPDQTGDPSDPSWDRFPGDSDDDGLSNAEEVAFGSDIHRFSNATGAFATPVDMRISWIGLEGTAHDERVTPGTILDIAAGTYDLTVTLTMLHDPAVDVAPSLWWTSTTLVDQEIVMTAAGSGVAARSDISRSWFGSDVGRHTGGDELSIWNSAEQAAHPVEDDTIVGHYSTWTAVVPTQELTIGDILEFHLTWTGRDREAPDDSPREQELGLSAQIQVTSSVLLVEGITPDGVVALAGGAMLSLILAGFHMPASMEATTIRRRSLTRYEVRPFIKDRDDYKRIMQDHKRAQLVFGAGVAGLMILALELFFDPDTLSTVSAVAIAALVVPVVTLPAIYLLTQALRDIRRPRAWTSLITASSGLALVITGLLLGFTILYGLFLLLFAVPLFLYGNIMGSSWNFMIHNGRSILFHGRDLLSGREFKGVGRLSALPSLLLLASMPLTALNVIHAMLAERGQLPSWGRQGSEDVTYEDGGQLGTWIIQLLDWIDVSFGWDIGLGDVMAGWVGLLIVANVTITGVSLMGRVVKLQLTGANDHFGLLGYDIEKPEDVLKKPESARRVIEFSYIVFFGYAILLLVISIYTQFADILPVIPGLSQGLFSLFTKVVNVSTNSVFLVFFAISIPKFLKLLVSRFEFMEGRSAGIDAGGSL